VLLLIAALLIKKEYKVERVIIIDQPVGRVFDYILFLKHQRNFNKWWMVDPHATIAFRGNDGNVGCIVDWDSNHKQLGKGEQEIIKIEMNHRIDFEIRFIKPFPNIAQVYMITEPITDDITRLTWGFLGKNKFPFSLMNLFIDNLLGKDLAISAVTLKDILEKEN
jgi:uncharacterized protein YndB with AHSA1/START domain